MLRVFKLFGFIGSFILLANSGLAEETDSLNSGKYNIDLGKIVITASKLEQAYKYATQNISVISREDIESGPILEISEILDLLPSVDIQEYGAIGTVRTIHSRGSTSQQVLTLIDGRPINTPRDGLTDLSQISLSNIDRIEVLRGPASNIYGASAVGGVINIITKSGKEGGETNISGRYGSFATNIDSITHGNKIKDFDYFISYDYITSHGHRENSGHQSHNVNTKLGYQINDRNRVAVAGGYYNAETGSPGPTTFIDLDDRLETFNKYFDFTYNGKILQGQDILFKFYYNSDRLEFRESLNPTDKGVHHTKLYGLESQISQTFFDIFRTAIGVDYKDNRLNSSTSAKHRYYVNGLYFESEVDLLTESDFFLNNATLKFGNRWDQYSNFGDHFSPSASLSFWFFDTIKLHALAAGSFRAPTFNDLYWPTEDFGIFGGLEGNPNLDPEEAISYEAGLSTYLFNQFKTDITFFKSEFKDLIEWAQDDALWWRPTNLSGATVKGAEVETEFVLRDNLKFNLNYTYMESRNNENGFNLAYRPKHLYKLKTRYSPIEKLELGCNFIFKSSRYTNATNSLSLAHDWTVDLSAAYQLNDYAKVEFDVKNLLNRLYEEQRGYPLPQRTFYGGLKLSF
tara:strand:+ start:129 stop:2015 length:1887 start_codon:yes stop_codon:yes gene_type:complete